MFASSIFGAAIVSVLVSAISIRGALMVAALGISTLPGSTPAKAILGVTVASGSLTGVGGTAASLEDEGGSLIISRLPMGRSSMRRRIGPHGGYQPVTVFVDCGFDAGPLRAGEPHKCSSQTPK